jgi:hypothetical protein
LPPSTMPTGCAISSPGFAQPLLMSFMVCVLVPASRWFGLVFPPQCDLRTSRIDYSTPHSSRCFSIPSVVALG